MFPQYVAIVCRTLPRAAIRALQSFQVVKNDEQLTGVTEPASAETFTKVLRVEGTIPKELNGLYVRTGPNVQMKPAGGYHL
jgi:carotenoid cleavage dioxygenase-like enzyme